MKIIKPKNVARQASIIVGSVLVAVIPCTAKEPKLTSDAIISRHLDSIGSADARAAAVSRVSQGKVVFAEIIRHSLHMEGAATLLSQQRKHKCEFQFGNSQYPGEKFVFDGNQDLVAMVDQTSRSRLGNFLFLQEEVLREGLFGGILSTAWPLLNTQNTNPALKYERLKKINGQQLHEISYVPKKRSESGELSIRLYFEPETYHHVLTVYTLTMLHGSQTIYDPNQTTVIVEERFGDFQPVDGLTLPRHWDIRYRVEPQNFAEEYDWDVSLTQIEHNKL
ncbi:hypothetical protein EDE15_1284 [Edaphobacter aggregans]|uniref:Outer membrane lipoprotein-sorting protein n=1 Tax=Edaphobacter aggregans TaxID=570835 RepID=A0A3R9PQR2_9BACT|nr:hypothetical protein [Edaphobacter aggregans]RSL15781.1 hypothetical protein EDE15_1284 [Edaphobacter aggregans]